MCVCLRERREREGVGVVCVGCVVAKEDVWEGGGPINEIAKQIWSFLAEEGSVLIFHNS